MNNRGYWLRLAVLEAIRYRELDEKAEGNTGESGVLQAYRELLKTMEVEA